MGIISGASILQLWQPPLEGTAAEDAAATQQTSLSASQPTSAPDWTYPGRAGRGSAAS